jgi:hypothetical protein
MFRVQLTAVGGTATWAKFAILVKRR